MGVEGGLSTVQQIVLVIVSAILILGLALVFIGKSEELGCGWADQAVSGFYTMIGSYAPAAVCG